MADKPTKKPTSGGKNKDWELLITFLVAIGIIYGSFSYYFQTYTTSTGQGAFDKIGYYISFVPYYFVSFLAKFIIFGVFVSIAFAILSIIWWMKYQEEMRNTKESLKAVVSKSTEEKSDGVFTLKWQQVLKHANSENQNDWALAIISADVILGDLLDGMNLLGDTIGEKLKVVEKGDFHTLDNAWEAHKIRNAIAHSDFDFQINQREVKRVIALYETVFKEFSII